MSTKDIAIQTLNSMTEEQLQAFITLFADENTIARMETEQIMQDKSRKTYNSFAEIEKEIFSDETV
jgi:hypothetical protein